MGSSRTLIRRRGLRRRSPKSLNPSLLFLGQGDQPLEVVLASSAGRPAADDVRKMWTARKAHRASPVLLLTGYSEDDGTVLVVCGPVGEHPTLVYGLAISQVERLTAAALGEPRSAHGRQVPGADVAGGTRPICPACATQDCSLPRNCGTAYRHVMTGQRPQQQASHFCPSLAAVSSRDSGSP